MTARSLKSRSRTPAAAVTQRPWPNCKERYRQLNERKIAAETEHRGAKKRLEELQAEALAKYGTDDLAELQRKLAEIKADNENKRAQYQADLEKIEGDLAAVEQQFDTVSTAPDAPLAKRS